jgi:hypothetical protein
MDQFEVQLAARAVEVQQAEVPQRTPRQAQGANPRIVELGEMTAATLVPGSARIPEEGPAAAGPVRSGSRQGRLEAP